MALKLQKKISENQKISIISELDTAIDWQQSFPAFSSEENKRKEYVKTREISDLVFLPDESPTVFHFSHPRRIDIYERAQSAILDAAGVIPGRKSEQSLMRSVLNLCYLGESDGLSGEMKVIQRDKDGNIPADYLQGMLDAGVFEEFATVLLSELNRAPESRQKK